MPILKNVAGQYLYATLVSAVDGSAITAAAAVYLSGDAGAQAAGAGALSHLGNGQWRYALTQADTNVNTFGYTFGGTNVVPQGGMVVTVDYPRNAIPPAQAGTAGGLPALDGSAHLLAYSVAQPVTVGTNNDKSGYALTTAPPTLTQIVNGVWDEPKSSHTSAGSFGLQLDAAVSSRLPTSSYTAPSDPWAVALPGSYGAGTAGKILGTNLDAAVSSRSTYAGADTAGTATLLARLTGARAASLDNLDAAVSSRLATTAYVASSDPWAVPLPGSYGAGTAGKILGGNLDAAVSSRSTYAGGPVASVTAPVTVGTNGDKTGYSLSSAPPTLAQIVGGVWDEATSGHATAGSFGLLVGANLDAAVSSRSTFDPTRPVPCRNQDAVTAPTYDDAYQGAWAEAFGKEAIVGTAYEKRLPDDSGTSRTFTLDSGTSPTSRS